MLWNKITRKISIAFLFQWLTIEDKTKTNILKRNYMISYDNGCKKICFMHEKHFNKVQLSVG